MQFNQVNQNAGDVNNAISEKGNVIQTIGDKNKIAVEQPKGFWSQLWSRIKACLRWITGN